MTVETATYVSDLNASYPAAGDTLGQGDDHIRLLKSTIKATFPNVTGAVTATHTQLNQLASGALGLASDGTLALPGLSFASDPDTGIYRSGANAASLVGGGVAALSWTDAAVTLPLATTFTLLPTFTVPLVAASLASNAITTAKITDANVTYAKIQNVSATDKLLGRSTAGAGVVEEIALTGAGRALIDDTDAAAQRTTLGLGASAVAAFAVLADAQAGTSTTLAMNPARTFDSISAYLGFYACFRDEKASATSAGTFTSGSFVTRTLNTSSVNGITGASLASNQITLPAGTYRIRASAPAFAVNQHKAKLRNITDSTDAILGTTENADSGTNVATRSVVDGQITIAGTKVFELQHRCTTSRSTDGLGGFPCSYSVVEVYAEVEIWKVA